MGDDSELWEEYQKQKMEYLMNKKPERYKLLFGGMSGFLIGDTLKERYGDGKCGYSYIPSFTNEGFEEDSRHYNIRELVDELNYLDFQVNGGLYDEYYHILANKDRVHSYINNHLDSVLNNLGRGESFKVHFQNYATDEPEEVEVKVSVSRKGYEELIDDSDSSSMVHNLMLVRFMDVINKYLDEVEDSSVRDDMIREDTLVELKMRLLGELGFR